VLNGSNCLTGGLTRQPVKKEIRKKKNSRKT